LIGEGDTVVAMEDVAGKLQVLAIAGGAVELDQRHFDLRMTSDDRFLVCAGPIIRKEETVDEPNACIQ